jgi:hypothetical protein
MHCGNDARSASADIARRIAEYIAGYADAQADHRDDVDTRCPRESEL